MASFVSERVGLGVSIGLGAAADVSGWGVIMAIGVPAGVGAGAEVAADEGMGVGSGPPQAARANAITTGKRNVRLERFTPPS